MGAAVESTVGLAVGLAVGLTVGLAVGPPVIPTTVGLAEKFNAGAGVNPTPVGITDGAAVGPPVPPTSEGAFVGPWVTLFPRDGAIVTPEGTAVDGAIAGARVVGAADPSIIPGANVGADTIDGAAVRANMGAAVTAEGAMVVTDGAGVTIGAGVTAGAEVGQSP